MISRPIPKYLQRPAVRPVPKYLQTSVTAASCPTNGIQQSTRLTPILTKTPIKRPSLGPLPRTRLKLELPPRKVPLTPTITTALTANDSCPARKPEVRRRRRADRQAQASAVTMVVKTPTKHETGLATSAPKRVKEETKVRRRSKRTEEKVKTTDKAEPKKVAIKQQIAENCTSNQQILPTLKGLKGELLMSKQRNNTRQERKNNLPQPLQTDKRAYYMETSPIRAPEYSNTFTPEYSHMNNQDIHFLDESEIDRTEMQKTEMEFPDPFDTLGEFIWQRVLGQTPPPRVEMEEEDIELPEPEAPNENTKITTTKNAKERRKRQKSTAATAHPLRNKRRQAKGAKYVCEECDVTMFSHQSLERHLEAKHLKLKNFICEHCGDGFGYFSTLKNHRITVHSNSDIGELVCDNCHKCFHLFGALSGHLRICRPEGVVQRLRCDDCDRIRKQFPQLKRRAFFTEAERERHMQTAHRQQKCPKCDQVFDSRCEYQQHLKSGHNVELRNYGWLKRLVRTRVCDGCNKSLSYAPTTDSNDPKRFGRHVLNCTLATSSLCKICNVYFASEQSRDKHRVQDHPLHFGRFTCPLCAFTTRAAALLKEHEVTMHQERRPTERLVCDECNGWYTKHDMRRHYDRQHCERRRHACNECERTFDHKRSLLIHGLRRHDSIEACIRTYDCDNCNACFNTRDALGGHFRDNICVFTTLRCLLDTTQDTSRCCRCEQDFADQQSLEHHQSTECRENVLTIIGSSLLTNESTENRMHLTPDEVPAEHNYCNRSQQPTERTIENASPGVLPIEELMKIDIDAMLNYKTTADETHDYDNGRMLPKENDVETESNNLNRGPDTRSQQKTFSLISVPGSFYFHPGS